MVVARSRNEVLKVLEDWGNSVTNTVLNNEEPILEIPSRTLSNTIWDPKRKMLILGPEKLRRRFLDLKESKRFMQTMLMLKLIVQAIREGVYPTIRDLYYNGKHTMEFKADIVNKVIRENTWDEQSESNAVIEDIEVATGILREEMGGLSADVKGKVVGGPIIVRSKALR